MACANVGGANPFVCVCCVCGHDVCVDLSPRSVCIWKGGVNPCVCAYHKHTYIYTHETSITSRELKRISRKLTPPFHMYTDLGDIHIYTHTSTSTHTHTS